MHVSHETPREMRYGRGFHGQKTIIVFYSRKRNDESTGKNDLFCNIVLRSLGELAQLCLDHVRPLHMRAADSVCPNTYTTSRTFPHDIRTYISRYTYIWERRRKGGGVMDGRRRERETISDDLPLLSLTLTCLEALERRRGGQKELFGFSLARAGQLGGEG